MARIKVGVTAHARHKKILKLNLALNLFFMMSVLSSMIEIA